MKAKWMISWIGGMVLMMILLTGHQPAAAAPPTGEVKTVASNFGNGVPIPFFEIPMANDWMFLLYDHLLGRTPDAQLSTETGVANKWESSPDALTWTFYLRKGIKFHNGVELTAKDVKFSLEQLMGPGALSDAVPILKREVKSIEAKDPYTVVINLKEPDIFLSTILRDGALTGMVVPKDYYEKVGKDEFAKHPIGSGPYKFHSMVPGSFVKLEATGEKHWRDGVPKYKYMTYQTIPEESTRLAMLRTGEADITRISREVVKDARNAGLNVLTRNNAQVVVFHVNMQWTSPVFSDVRFRKALNLALDRESIIKNLFIGLAMPYAAYPGSSTYSIGADLTLKPYPYDPQEARRLIKEGGWEGFEFTLISMPRPGCPEFPQLVEAVAGYWEKIGLKPKIRMTEWNVFRVALRERKSQNTIHGVDSFITPNVGSLSVKFGDKFYFRNSESTVNIPEVNEKFDRIVKSMDISEISKLLSEIYRYGYDQYLMIPIAEINDLVATTKRIPQWNLGSHENARNYNDLIREQKTGKN